MSSEKRFTIIAGINGAGKTSLYHVLRQTEDLGKRINIDELAKEFGGQNDPRANIQAGRTAMEMIGEYIEKGISFHIETTLPGAAIVKHITSAKKNGFTVVLCFVGIDDIKVAIDRVHRRMASGGHGIGDKFIIKRFSQLNNNLRAILPLCDEAVLFDNTKRFRQVAILENKRLVDCDGDVPYWFIDLIDELPD
ncbi:MAG: zeta toxin family protein [Clostridia bacterium]|nr:zeta toxin family protein [Clostridia bacterium]